MYGIVPLEVCIAIEDKIGKNLRDIFDLFVGTSTGALILAGAFVKSKFGLPSDGKPRVLSAQELMEMYFDIGIGTIFSEKAKNDPISIPIAGDLYIKNTRYQQEFLRKAVVDVLGSGRRMDRLNIDHEGFISLSAYNMSQGKTHFFRSWIDKTINLEDAVLASASAPTYHPLYDINGEFYTDGGVFARDPSSFALGDAFELCETGKWPNDADIVLVSLGTGSRSNQLEPEASGDEGELWWARRISNVFLDGQDETTHHTLTRIANNSNKRIKYHRFQVDLDGIPRKKADETNRETLEKAREITRKELSGSQSSNFDKVISDIENALVS